MNLRVHLAVLAVLALTATAAFATDDGPVITTIIGNLNHGDSNINIGNDGASGGNICVNVYAFSPDEQLVSCCACPLTVHATASLSVRNDIINNTLTPAVPSTLQVQLVSTVAPAGGCNASAPGALTVGEIASGTTVAGPFPEVAQVEGGTRVPLTWFDMDTPSAADLGRTQAICGFIQSNGSGLGICGPCRTGALGGRKL